MSNDIGIGQLITTPQQRDAVHVAIAPVFAGEDLQPGQHVGFRFVDDCTVYSETRLNSFRSSINNPQLVGVIDPYLKTVVPRGSRCWLFVYPNTVTGMRHQWQHPLFPGWKQDALEESERFLADFAREVRLTFQELMDATQNYIETGDMHCLPFDTPDNVWSDREEFWVHYERVAKCEVSEDTKSSIFFRCAC